MGLCIIGRSGHGQDRKKTKKLLRLPCGNHNSFCVCIKLVYSKDIVADDGGNGKQIWLTFLKFFETILKVPIMVLVIWDNGCKLEKLPFKIGATNVMDDMVIVQEAWYEMLYVERKKT